MTKELQSAQMTQIVILDIICVLMIIHMAIKILITLLKNVKKTVILNVKVLLSLKIQHAMMMAFVRQ